MASNKSESDRELKYLGFVRVIAIKAIVCVWSMYEYVKEHSGPFKCCIGMKERVATAFVRPFYNKFKGIPDDILFYFDNKVDKVINKFEELAPALAKKLVIKLQPVVQKLIQIGQNLLQEAITAGVTAAIRSAMAESMKLMPKIPTLDSISNLSPIGNVAEKGLSILGDVTLNPIGGLANVFNKQEGDAEATSAEGEKKTE